MTDDHQNNNKVYHRQFQADSGESLALVAKHIGYDSNVLDVGCGAGDLGEFLRAEKQCTVTGVDYSKDSVTLAKNKLDAVYRADLNAQNLEDIIDDTFDVIVMADILEHVYTPTETLRSAEKLLKPDGKVIISIPNAGYVGALISLYDDAWHYREEGILDRTHIRFYTKQSVMELLEDSEFNGIVCDRVVRDLLDSEFTQRIDCQPNAVRDWLLAKPEGSTYQFIVEARPKTQRYKFPAEAPRIPMSLQHIVKCYWQGEADETFSDKNMLISRGHMGQENKLQFSTAVKNLSKLRFDFADRRGVYRLASVDIQSDGKCLWSSEKNEYFLTSKSLYSEAKNLPMTAMALDNQASIEITLSDSIKGEELSITLTLSAPIGEQNIAFADSISLHEYQKVTAEQQRLATELAKTHAEAGAYAAKLEETLEHERYLAKEKQQYFAHQLDNYQSEIKRYDSTTQQLQTDIANQQKYINNLLQSSSWKITAPLRKIISLIK